MKKQYRLHYQIFRINISYLKNYGIFKFRKGTIREPNISPELQILKSDVLELILKKEISKGLQYYTVVWQTHMSTGQPHLDVLLVYNKSIFKSLSSYDYLLPLCEQRESKSTPGVHITGYSKTRLNQAILDYGSKEDPDPLTTLPEDLGLIINARDLQRDPYSYLYDKMKLDPLNFNLEEYVEINNLSKYIKGWSSIKTKLKDMQVAAANLHLKSKSGFKFITRDLIESRLNTRELELFDSWKGYQTIINHLNLMVVYGCNRNPKSLNLLITGPPNCGKSALVWHPLPEPQAPYNPLSKYISIYPMGLSQWFPKYQSGTYRLIYWNEMKLTSYSFDTILKLLDGSPLDLSNKGSVSRKVDNPLIIMTSNMTLDQMIQDKFFYNRKYVEMAKANLGVRIENVIVPAGYDLFILQKLLIPN